MTNPIHVVIYHTKNCMKCRLTAERFEKADIPVTKILVDPNTEWGEQKLNKFKLAGHQAFPVIRVYAGMEDDGSEAIDTWSNFEIDKIREWINE